MTCRNRVGRWLTAVSALLIGSACGQRGSDWVVPTPPAEAVGTQIRITGTVAYTDVEGGVYTIRGEDSVIYNPTNLPAEFRRDGLSVEAEARRRDDLLGIHQVGPIVQLERIRMR